MSNGFRLELNRAGVAALLKSPEMEQGLVRLAQDIRSRCGEGYETDTYRAATRVIASVSTGSRESMLDNSENQTILRALGTPMGAARTGKRVQSYTRTLKDGRVITVRAYRRKQ